MIQFIRVAIAVYCIALAALAIAVFLGCRRFRARVAADVSALLLSPAPATRTVHLRHEGFFRPKPGSPWLPILGEQYFSAGRKGFVCNATVRMKPSLWIEARSSLGKLPRIGVECPRDGGQPCESFWLFLFQ
jgi:hypothetical protein